MADDKKTFTDIATLTTATYKSIVALEQTNLQASTIVLVGQLECQLAIAQQLSVISGTLKDLLELCKSQSSKTTKAKS